MHTNVSAPAFGNDPWALRETSFSRKGLRHREAVFSLGNGSLGLRGSFEEAYEGAYEGTYLNGFYESAPIRYGEIAFGYAKSSQTMLKLANAARIGFLIDGEAFSMDVGEVISHSRTLSFCDGVLERETVWRSRAGKTARVSTKRLVCLSGGDAAMFTYSITPLSPWKELIVSSEIDANISHRTVVDDPRVGSALERSPLETVALRHSLEAGALAQRTKNSRLAYACAVDHKMDTTLAYAAKTEAGENRVRVAWLFQSGGAGGETVCLTKSAAYSHGKAGEETALLEHAQALASSRLNCGVSCAQKENREALNAFWENAGLDLKGDDISLQGLRFSAFSLFQSASRNEACSIAAKGLTGDGYEGHYFWDAETYVLPFLAFTAPKLARSMLLYRYNCLDAARQRARELSHEKGALYAWRTINGEECSAYYPAGTAQYHINADIAHAAVTYVEATGDKGFMAECGVELLAETARLYMELGFYSAEKGGAFCINGVTGPDEYNALVNNNCYTNLMAAKNLKEAAKWCAWLKENEPQHAKALFLRLALTDAETKGWEEAAARMYIPYDQARQVHKQDDAFFDRVPWPLASIPKENFPLLLHHHPLVIYRHMVCKQADLVLALLLAEEYFTPAQKKRALEVYEPLTTHDSSLSKAAFGILYAEVGDAQTAHRFFLSTARLDLDDEHGNSEDGLHMANMAGSWMGVVYGFGGMRLKDGTLCFSPVLPEAWGSFSFRLTFQGSLFEVRVGRDETEYALLRGGALSLSHHGERFTLSAANTARFPNHSIAQTR
ncbi:MAG TPA: glycosyl hydrolase family 65 protein [Clostridia bacterium]|nr:glycosyl hydrolase family 65 protein [Clostridia bacterium]